MGRADTVGEHERQARRGRLVHDHAPRLLRGEEREDVRADVLLSERLLAEVAADLEPDAQTVGLAGERSRSGAGARDDDPEARIVRGRDSPKERVETFLRHEPGDREDDDVLLVDPGAGAQLVTAGRELLCAVAPGVDVDGVREDAHPLGRRSARDDGLSRGAPDDEHARGAADEPRNDRALDRLAPLRSRPEVVALDEEHVRDPVRAAPGDRALRGIRAPARDDEDVGARLAKRTRDPRRHRIVVAEDRPHARARAPRAGTAPRDPCSTDHVRPATVLPA